MASKLNPNLQQESTVCVIGAAGYIGSWLVTRLLEKDYTVHATIRDPANVSHLLSLPGAQRRLRLFKAELTEEGSFDMAVTGCQGVFHLATPVRFNSNDPQEEIVQPAIKGVLNVLKASVKAKSVRRVVYTSSVSTLSAMDETGKWKQSVDELCWASLDFVNSKKPDGWPYVVSKILAEQAALKFARENDVDVISIIPVTVAGPFLTPTVPTSVQVAMSLITGNPEFLGILKAVQSRMCSISLVHIDDICSAHMLLMESQEVVQGRYICSAYSSSILELAHFISEQYPGFTIPTGVYEVPDPGGAPVQISSNRLLDLGFKYKYGMAEIVSESIKCCKDKGLMDR